VRIDASAVPWLCRLPPGPGFSHVLGIVTLSTRCLALRIRAKGSSVVRARKWRLQPPEKSPSSGEAPASVPAPSSLAAPSTVRLDSFSAAPSLDSVEGSHTSCLGPYHVPDIGDFEQGTPTSIQDDVIRPPTVAVLPAEGKGMCQRRISPSSPAPAATGLPSGDDSAPPAFLEVEASVVPPPFVGPQDSPQSPGPPPAGAGGRSITCSNRGAGRISPPTSSPALAAALALWTARLEAVCSGISLLSPLRFGHPTVIRVGDLSGSV